MVQLLTDGGPPALVSAAIIDMLSSGAAGGGSSSVLLSADLVQRAGKHAMLLFVYVAATSAHYCFVSHYVLLASPPRTRAPLAPEQHCRFTPPAPHLIAGCPIWRRRWPLPMPRCAS